MIHILSVLVENKSGVLSRVTGMISRRGFNIESLTVAPTEDETLSRMTIIVEADEVSFEQITKQLHKLVAVYKISDLTHSDAIERELVLFKVQASPERRHERNRQQTRCHGGPLPKLRHQAAHPNRQDRYVARRARSVSALTNRLTKRARAYEK